MHSGRGIKLLAGTSHPEMADLIAKRLGIDLSPVKVTHNGIGETQVQLQESVREEDVYILGTSASGSVNTALMELCIMIHACKIASAGRITAVIPHFPYARQDRKEKSRAPISAKLVANMLQTSGCDHVITMDLHASQIQGFFDVPVDNLYGEPSMIRFIRDALTPDEHPTKDIVIVSPDAGGTKRAASIADKLNTDLAIFHKERKKENQVSRMILVGSVRDKIAILVDDMADTCGTLELAAHHLIEAGARKVWAVVTHGVLSGRAEPTIRESALEKLVITNTLPVRDKLEAQEKTGAWGGKLEVIDITGVLAETVRRSHYGESVSKLFDEVPWSTQ
ncbi:phosphoribosyl pyrophosphokinase [Calocera cornea HHB12733]|uniref:ribose-phosphate diphosphokinase n=1 Tax=Calocera cornea HHB12733 TaxID=1353952 RepID=A0A165E9R9_9BASI|nr:phosphoribosyl pyrophosphokinase [Calocera cornea HHB12733]